MNNIQKTLVEMRLGDIYSSNSNQIIKIMWDTVVTEDKEYSPELKEICEVSELFLECPDAADAPLNELSDLASDS